MRLSIFIAGAVVAAWLSTPAQAESPRRELELFKAICLAHEGDLAGAEAEALKMGLVMAVDNRGKPLADGEVEMMFTPADTDQIEVKLSPAPDDLFGVPGSDVSLCAVRGADEDGSLSAGARALADELGLPKGETPDRTRYVLFYAKSPTGMAGISSKDDEGMRAAILAGQFRFFYVQTNSSNVTMVTMMTGLKGSAK